MPLPSGFLGDLPAINMTPMHLELKTLNLPLSTNFNSCCSSYVKKIFMGQIMAFNGGKNYLLRLLWAQSETFFNYDSFKVLKMPLGCTQDDLEMHRNWIWIQDALRMHFFSSLLDIRRYFLLLKVNQLEKLLSFEH